MSAAICYCRLNDLKGINAALNGTHTRRIIDPRESDLTWSAKLFVSCSALTPKDCSLSCSHTPDSFLIVDSIIRGALRTIYISLSLDQIVFVWVSSVCCAFGIAKFPNIIAWWFPSPPVANCLSTASIRCVVLTISSADL